MDSSISDGTDTDNEGDLAVAIGTLEIDGVRPKVGDQVDVKVSGSIKKIVNETAWVNPETVNDLPMPTDTPDVSDDEKLMAGANAMDAAAGGY